MKKSGIAVGIISMAMAVYAVAGTANDDVSFKGLKVHSIPYVSIGKDIPPVGSRFINADGPLTIKPFLEYSKVHHQYRVVLNNYEGRYINLKHSKDGQWYFPISKEEGLKTVAIMKNTNTANTTTDCKAYLTNYMARPCTVQKSEGKNTIRWVPRTFTNIYSEMRKIVRVNNQIKVYMDVLGVGFSADSGSIILKANLPLTK